ncbi:MAG: hypothetical protein ACFFC3_05170 [Candidatus Odinarchaeota archaeon]
MKEISEKQNEMRRNEERVKISIIFFLVGTIIIGLAILVIMADTGFRMYHPTVTGYYAMLALLAYYFGILLVVYSIHLVRNKWAWLDCPIFIIFFFIINLFAPNLSIWDMPMPYRVGWLLILPLNYVVLLILFLASIKREKVI